jgi:hypothetical protein
MLHKRYIFFIFIKKIQRREFKAIIIKIKIHLEHFKLMNNYNKMNEGKKKKKLIKHSTEMMLSSHLQFHFYSLK